MKEKQIYKIMNMFKVQNSILIGQIWLPKN